MNKYTFDSKERKAEIVKDSKPYFSFKLEDYNPQALSHCYAVVSVYAHVETLYSDILSDMKFRDIHNSDVKVTNLKIERWESEDYEVTEREHEDYKHEITKEEWAEEEKMSGEAELILGGKVGDTVTRQRVSKEWQETRTKWLWKEYDPRISKGLIPQGGTVKLRISFDKPFDFYNQAESSVDWIPVVTKDTEIKELSWFNSSWSYRRKFTSDNTKVASAYPYAMILDLSQFPADFFTKIKSGGEDIRITKSDGTTELARGVREVVTTVDSEAGLVYFHADGISTSADTDFYIYYGNSDASDYADDNAKGMENVFSTNYKFHSTMEDLTTSTIKDETSNDNDGTKESENSPIESTGEIGKAQDFQQATDEITSNVALPGTGDFSLGGWIETSDVAHFSVMFRMKGTGTDLWVQPNTTFGNANNNIRILFDSAEIIGPDIRNTGWRCLVVTRSGNTFTLYVDSSNEGTDTDSGSSSGTMVMASDGTGSIFKLDEVFLTHNALSTNEITTIYNNQSDNASFWTVGSEETETADTVTHTVDTLLLKTSAKEPQELTDGKWLETDQYFDAENVVNTTDTGEHLELAEESTGVFHSSGYRVSNPLSLDSIKKVKSSNIKWTSTTQEEELSEFYEEGEEYSDLTGGWVAGYSFTGSGTSGTQSKETGHLYLEVERTSGTSSAVRTYRTSNKIDVTDINTLKIRWKNDGYFNRDRVGAAFGISEDDVNAVGDGSGWDAIVYENGDSLPFAEKTSSVDVSGFSGSYYVLTQVRVDGADGSSKSSVYEMWGEDADGNKINIGGTDLKIYTAISDSNTVEPTFPTDYDEEVSDTSIDSISTEQDLTGKYLWVRQELTTEDTGATPRLSTLEYSVETETADTVTHTVDTLLLKEETAEHTVDTSVFHRESGEHTTDTTLLKEETETHTVDTLIYKQETSEHTTDTVLYEQNTSEHTVDTFTDKDAETVEHTVDTRIAGTVTETHTVDTSLIKKDTEEHTVDAVTYEVRKSEHTVDTALNDVETSTHTVDTYITGRQIAEHTVDSRLRGALKTTHTVDTNIKGWAYTDKNTTDDWTYKDKNETTTWTYADKHVV